MGARVVIGQARSFHVIGIPYEKPFIDLEAYKAAQSGIPPVSGAKREYVII